MNPMNRRMFRDPRAARRATGILASSAPLMTAAQKAVAQGQPMRAQTGAAVNTRNRLFDPAQIMRGIQYPLEYFGMPVPSSAPGVPVGTIYKDTGLDRLMFGTEERKTPIQGALTATDTAVRGVTGSALDSLAGADAAMTRGIVSAFTPQETELGAARRQEQELRLAMGDPYMDPDKRARAMPSTAGSDVLMGDDDFLEMQGSFETISAPASSAPSSPPAEKPEEDVSGMMVPTPKPKRPAKEPEAQKVITPEIVEQLDPTAGLSDMERNQRAAPVGKAVTNKVTDIQSGNLSEAKKREKTNEVLGIDSLEKEYAVLKEFFGEDRAKDVRTDANYNLMMTGLMIAAGESDNAMTNIAKGAAAGLQKYGEAVGEESREVAAEDKAIKSLVAKTALERREKQEDRSFQELQADRAFGRQVAITGYGADLRGEEAEKAHKRAVELRDKELAAAKSNVLAQISSNEKLAQTRLDEGIRQFDANIKLKQDQLDLKPDQLRVIEAISGDDELYASYVQMQKAGKTDPVMTVFGGVLGNIMKDPMALESFSDEDGNLDTEKLMEIARVLNDSFTTLNAPAETSE
jgi:hypothetical protein